MKNVRPKVMALLLATMVISCVLLYDATTTAGRSSRRRSTPRMYKQIDDEALQSSLRLEQIDELIANNLHALPGRIEDLTAEEMCHDENETQCMPPLRRFEAEYRTAPKYKLSTCVVQKSLSTITTAMFCYLLDEQKFVDSNRLILKDWKVIRFCQRKNEFMSMTTLLHKNKDYGTAVKTPTVTASLPVVPDHCNGCGSNLTCFLETELARMRFQVQRGEFYRSFEDRHFFPQNWRCDLDRHMDKFTFVRYDSATEDDNSGNSLFDAFRHQKVPQASINYIKTSLSSGKTAHATIGTQARNFLEKRLRSSPYLMELLVRMFYHDFRLFNFTLPEGF